MVFEDNERIENSIIKGVDYLVSNQNEDGSITLENDKTWQVWETANAILAVHNADKEKKPFLEKAVNFLLSCQRKDGSFYYTISYEKDEYCMETTSIGVLALAITQKNVSKNIDFILSKQNPDGSWEIGIPRITKYRCWPSITGYTLNTLLSMNVSSDQISKGIKFLLKEQQENGSWGSKWMYYDTPYYPIHAILPALKLNGLKNDERYLKAIRFIEKNQNKDGSWEYESTDKPRPSVSLRTALALNSLLVSPDQSDLKCIEKGIKWLINAQKNNGCWDGGYFVNWPGKKEDIYTTCVAIRALKQFNELHKKY
jgi:squalene cyclase